MASVTGVVKGEGDFHCPGVGERNPKKERLVCSIPVWGGAVRGPCMSTPEKKDRSYAGPSGGGES